MAPPTPPPGTGAQLRDAGVLPRSFWHPAAAVLADRPGTSGFVVQNEGAIGPLLSLLRAAGRVVPEDASVVALCQEPLAEQFSPRLTAVSGQTRELGTRAVELVMSRLNGERPDDVTLLTPVLTRRESSGPAPKGD